MYLSGAFGGHADDVNPYAASAFFAVDRYASYRTTWKKWHDAGDIILADRYTTSNMVHQAVKIRGAREREAFLDWLYDFEFRKMGLPVPDAVVFLDMAPEVADRLIAARAAKTGAREDIHERDKEYLARCHAAYLALAEKYGWARIPCSGKMDVVAIGKAVEADCIITGGFSLKPKTLDDIEKAYKRRGIIILTDPDSAGERIRKFLAKRFPDAKHAFIPVEEATAHDDIGVEQAQPPAIRAALARVHTLSFEPTEEFTGADLIAAGLTGTPDAAARRARLGAALGLGFANAKTFLKRLNHYGVTRAEFQEALAALEKGENA